MPAGWGGLQRCWENREAWGTAHLQSDRREAAIPGQRPRRRLRLLLRPSAPLPPGLDGHSAEAECSQSWGLNGAMALPGAGCISGTGVFLKTVAFSDICLFSESLALSGTSLFPETALSSSTEIFWDTEHLLGLGVSGSRLASGSSVFPAAVGF